MRIRLIIFSLFLLAAGNVVGSTPPTTQPSTQPGCEALSQPQAKRAQDAVKAQLSELERDFRLRRADILRRYAASLSEAQRTAQRAGEIEEAQRIFEAASAVLDEVAVIDPDGNADPIVKGRPIKPFSVKVEDFDGAAGFTEVVTVDQDSISVVGLDDFGHPPKVLWKAALRPRQRQHFSAYMSDFPLAKLEDEYVDQHVFDGFQATFSIKIGAAQERRIKIGNMHQRDLENLIGEINSALPPKFHLSGIGSHSSFRASN